MVRINTLDYLRGLMALGIMLYHYFSWTFHPYESDTLLGVTGIYGVSIFYILSGLTLFYVYDKSLNIRNVAPFFIKRIFRILPLLGLSVLANVFLFDRIYKTKTILMNVTGLFGFFSHDGYITTGSWSIGNEIVFYSIFPIIIILSKWKHYFIEIFFGLSTIIALYFAFDILNNSGDLKANWSNYINPFNQLFLFIGGILIGKIVGDTKSNSISILLIIVCTLSLIFYQVEGDKINLVNGWNRIIFSLKSFAITIAFLLFNFNVPKQINWVLSKLGHISYSTYMIHAIVYWFMNQYIPRKESLIYIFINVGLTLVISWIIYNLFEKTFVRLGKKLLVKINL